MGLRDRAILAVLVFTAARVGAVAKLTFKSLRHDGTEYALRFSEKGGKSREIPVRADLQKILLAYIQAAGISDGPLFRTAVGKTGMLTENPMTAIDICRMMKRRLKAAGLPTDFSPHSFRVTTITDLLEHNTALEDVQHLAGHADPRTTRLYDRRRRKVTRNIVERISINIEPGMTAALIPDGSPTIVTLSSGRSATTSEGFCGTVYEFEQILPSPRSEGQSPLSCSFSFRNWTHFAFVTKATADCACARRHSASATANLIRRRAFFFFSSADGSVASTRV